MRAMIRATWLLALLVGCAHPTVAAAPASVAPMALSGWWENAGYQIQADGEQAFVTVKTPCTPHANSGCAAGQGQIMAWDAPAHALVPHDGPPIPVTEDGDALVATLGGAPQRLRRQPTAAMLGDHTWSDGHHEVALRADGTCTITRDDTTQTGTWTLDGSELDLQLDGAEAWSIWFDGLATLHVDAGARWTLLQQR